MLYVLQLEEHRRQECMERRFPCSDCGALFLGPWRLRNHRVAVHPKSEAVVDVNAHQCCKCSQGFETEEELLKHQETFASALNCEAKPQGKKRGQNPKSAAQCGVADKKIKQEEGADECQGYSDYTTERFPSSEPQTEPKIPCPEADCNLLFSSVAVLRAHKKECHGPLPCKTYTCTECNESCTRPKRLKANKGKNHCSGLACLTCGKSFVQEHPKDIWGTATSFYYSSRWLSDKFYNILLRVDRRLLCKNLGWAFKAKLCRAIELSGLFLEGHLSIAFLKASCICEYNSVYNWYLSTFMSLGHFFHPYYLYFMWSASDW